MNDPTILADFIQANQKYSLYQQTYDSVIFKLIEAGINPEIVKHYRVIGLWDKGDQKYVIQWSKRVPGPLTDQQYEEQYK
jgi:hypothetical protein